MNIAIMNYFYDVFWHINKQLKDIIIDIVTEYLIFNEYENCEAADRDDSTVFQSS